MTRTRALERFDSAFGGGGASEIDKQVAAAAADAADAAGAFRPWPKTDDQTRRALLASTPGPAASRATRGRRPSRPAGAAAYSSMRSGGPTRSAGAVDMARRLAAFRTSSMREGLPFPTT